MIAKDIMTRDVTMLREDSRIIEACKVLSEKRISGAPIVNQEGKLVGIITERDLLLHHPLIKSVKDLMTKDVITVNENAPVEEISRLLLEHSIKRVLVLREDEIVGIISRLDILRGKVAFGEYA